MDYLSYPYNNTIVHHFEQLHGPSVDIYLDVDRVDTITDLSVAEGDQKSSDCEILHPLENIKEIVFSAQKIKNLIS